MKRLLLSTVFGFAATLGMSALPAASANNGSNLIIPGQRVGQTYLGPNGSTYLRKLPKPTSSDAFMQQQQLVWVSKKANRTDTLSIHTISNAALNVQPSNGVTINRIRVTSNWFHTSPGNLSTGSTKAQILRHFPNARPVSSNPLIYDDVKGGIAFEFAPKATDSSPCIAITAHLPE